MRQFLDSASPQRTWTISITAGTIKRVLGSIIEGGPIHLGKINEGEPPLILKLMTDPILFCDVLYCLCKPESDKLGLTDEQFGEAMGGDAIFAAQQAFFEELKDFFRNLDLTKMKVVSQAERVMKATMEAANKRTDTIDIEAISERIVGKLFTDAQASLESTLNHSPSAS